MNDIQIAIDGPSGSGKSTISKIIAEGLSITYLDTGAMYRAITLKTLDMNINFRDIERIKKLLSDTSISFINNKVHLDGKDVSIDIRSIEVTENVSKISAIKEVREHLVKAQQKIASSIDIIMDGRDIGTRVLPNAKYKFFLNASIDERARRRHEEFLSQGKVVEYEKIREDIEIRDYNDSNRKESPLVKACDAIEIDTTKMSIEEVVKYIISFIKKGENNEV